MKKIYDVIVIGAGPAGMMAAITACAGTPMTLNTPKNRNRVLILEKNRPGGIALFGNLDITRQWTIPGKILTEKLTSEIKQLKIDLKLEEVIKTNLKKEIKIVKTNAMSYRAKLVIIAVGIFPYPQYLSDPHYKLLTDTYKNQNKYFSSLLGRNKFKRLLNLIKPILLIGSNSSLENTFQRLKKNFLQATIETRVEKSTNLRIDRKEFSKILFDYNSYKLNTPTTGFLYQSGLKVSQNGFIKADKDFRTNLKNVYVCGNICGTTSGILQAFYSGFNAGLAVYSFIQKKPAFKKLFPWLAVPHSSSE